MNSKVAKVSLADDFRLGSADTTALGKKWLKSGFRKMDRGSEVESAAA
jgi:hypothetical protein